MMVTTYCLMVSTRIRMDSDISVKELKVYFKVVALVISEAEVACPFLQYYRHE